VALHRFGFRRRSIVSVPLALQSVNDSFTQDVHGGPGPQVFKPALGGVSRWVRLYGHTEDIATLASGREARHEALASGYDFALCF
jgi:hypothetical protein